MEGRLRESRMQNCTAACRCQVYGTVCPSATNRALLQPAGVRYMAQYIQIEVFMKACSLKFVTQNISIPHTELFCSLQVSRVWHSRPKCHFLQPAWHSLSKCNIQSWAAAYRCQDYSTVRMACLNATSRVILQHAGVK